MEIRRAALDDAIAIEDLRIENWKTAYRKENLSKQDHNEFVALDGDEVVGWIVGGTSNDTSDGRTYEIRACYVKVSHWRRGIGTKMWEHLRAHTDLIPYDNIIVWALKGYERSENFYQSLGFVLEDKTEDHGNGEIVRRLIFTK